MTYFIDRGFLVHSIKQTIFSPFYEVVKTVTLQIKEFDDVSTSIPKNTIRFCFLYNQDGDSLYITSETKLFRCLINSFPTSSGVPINPKVNIREKALEVLIHYEKGFRKIWSEWDFMKKDEIYTSVGMMEMFKVIANKMEDELRA